MTDPTTTEYQAKCIPWTQIVPLQWNLTYQTNQINLELEPKPSPSSPEYAHTSKSSVSPSSCQWFSLSFTWSLSYLSGKYPRIGHCSPGPVTCTSLAESTPGPFPGRDSYTGWSCLCSFMSTSSTSSQTCWLCSWLGSPLSSKWRVSWSSSSSWSLEPSEGACSVRSVTPIPLVWASPLQASLY